MKRLLQLIKLFSLLFCCCFFACEEPVDLDIKELSPPIVVNGTFTNNQSFKVILTKSGSVLNNTPTQFIDNAKVSILNEENKVLGTLLYQKDAMFPHYQLKDLKPTFETSYHLSVDIPNYSNLSAVDQIPKPVPLQSILIDTISYEDGEGTAISSISLTADFKEPNGQVNFYHFFLYHAVVNGRAQTDGFVENVEERLMPLPITDIQENKTKASFDSDQVGILFSDEFINGQSVQLKLLAQIDELETGMYPKLVGELRTVSKKYYQYYLSLARQQESKDRPFIEPVPVFSNIENGVGIFAGYSTYRDSVTVAQ